LRYLSPPEKIANRTVADEYQAISAKIDALYGQQLELPADYETTGTAKLRREAHARMLGVNSEGPSGASPGSILPTGLRASYGTASSRCCRITGFARLHVPPDHSH
jgi:hypothetical protein